MRVQARHQSEDVSDLGDAEAARARYEVMSTEEVDDELRAAGIDPSAAISAVTALVRELTTRSRTKQTPGYSMDNARESRPVANAAALSR
jgi:hypothetical protein